MNTIALEYMDLEQPALVEIFKLADLLNVPPARAAKIYLTEKAQAIKRMGNPNPRHAGVEDQRQQEGGEA